MKRNVLQQKASEKDQVEDTVRAYQINSLKKINTLEVCSRSTRNLSPATEMCKNKMYTTVMINAKFHLIKCIPQSFRCSIESIFMIWTHSTLEKEEINPYAPK